MDNEDSTISEDGKIIDKYEKIGDYDLMYSVEEAVSYLFESEERDMGYAVDELINRYGIVAHKYNELIRKNGNV